MTLALFDLDNTLIAGDSDYLWGEFLVAHQLVDAASHREANAAFYRDYQRGELDVAAYLRFALKPLSRYSLRELADFHARFMQESIEPIWLPQAVSLIDHHRKLGHRLAVVTATNRFIVEPIVRRLGIEDLICSEPEVLNDTYTGNFTGTPCYAHGKVACVEQWLQKRPEENLADAWFYSDSHNDIPLLSLVKNPVAVDADEKLKQVSAHKNWPTISLR